MIGGLLALALVASVPGGDLDGQEASSIEAELARAAFLEAVGEELELVACESVYNFDDGALLVESWCYGLSEDGLRMGFVVHDGEELMVAVSEFTLERDGEWETTTAPPVDTTPAPDRRALP